MNVTLRVQRCSFPTSIHSTNPTRQNPPGSKNGPQRPIRSPSGPSTTRTPRPWPRRPTDDPNDPLTAPTRLHPKRPTYDPSASPIPSTQGINSRACTTSAATPAISTCSMRVRRDEEVRREGKGKEMEGEKEGEGKTRRDEGPTSDRRRDGRRRVPHVHTPHIHKTPAQPHEHAKRRASTPCVDSRACTASAATPAVSTRSTNTRKTKRQGRERRQDDGGRQRAHHVHETPARQTPMNAQRDEEARSGGKGKGDEDKRGREGKTRQRQSGRQQTTRQRGADDVPTTSTGYQHAKHCTSTPGIDGWVCTASAATPAINAQHEHTERRRETREGKTKEDETSKAEQKG
ncbi:hypothetical protein PAXINDRAFT_16562 [Paxillus involutus ATCC 200175]|uniref:Uncharacterized protein n=1 Tax=Paxillus involutus ATCC 200175 TaxID=664439 RepID=A0A0C9SRF1_PAXIN|nr:hypothetical protein PAXINDRAFT_16562 [Paxillus involutus ATCC 200175]